jgi:hypothetical protein
MTYYEAKEKEAREKRERKGVKLIPMNLSLFHCM